jgi:anti-anti-sigma factor
MAQSLPLRRVADRAIAAGTDQICIDLHGCTHMDSTFLGTLLAIKKVLEGNHKGQLGLLTPSHSCIRILQQMGLADILTTCDHAPDPQARWFDLPCETQDPSSFRRNIVQAHEELACLPGESGDQFRAVVRTIQQAERPAAPSPSTPPE